MTDITVPTLGESVTEATVGKWLKQPGEAVGRDEVVAELETDKVAVEVTAPADGTLSEIVAQEGATVEIGALLARLGEGAGSQAGDGGATAADAGPDHGGPGESGAPASNKQLSGGSMVDVAVPTMGESVSEGTIASFLKKAGETVSQDEPIAEIETDKVAVEVPAPQDGVISEWLVAEGDSVSPGSVIARIEAGSGEAAAPSQAAKAEVRSEAQNAGQSQAGVAQAGAAQTGGDRPVSPSVRRISAENDVNPADIPGSGKGGRATKGDALSYLEGGGAPKPAPQPASAPRDLGPREERVRMTRLRQTIARRLKEAQDTAAMLTTYNDVDMSAVMDMRKQYKDIFEKKHGVKLGFMSFFVKACVHALQEIPAVNAEIDGTDIIYKNFYDLGIAVGTERGLVVPVVRDCDQLSLAGIEKGIGELGRKARDGELSLEDLQGGTFTITNGGVYGSLMSSPILNPPQSGVLGMHRIEQRPVAINGEVKIRPMMYLALSYDHRIVDGKEAVTFLVRVKESLENPERMLLDL
jgi:2-oxoglutarate dehydrogenase E2 component (dihydrolipoamide succinyltransferase)